MVRSGLGISCFLAFGLMMTGCPKEVEDPGLTAGSSMTSAGSSSSSGGEASTSGDNSATSTTSDDTTGDPTTGPATTTGMTTGPATTTGAGSCGDGMVSPGEQCDGDDLQNFDCAGLGLGTGTLSCDPVACTFDTSMCMSTTSGTSG